MNVHKERSSYLNMKKLLQSIGYTLMLIVVFRAGAHIPVPGVNAEAVSSLVNSDAFSILNLFNGGALSNFSLFAMGVSPYITASIIVQLLQMDLVPALVEWNDQGEVGRRKAQKLTVFLSAFFGFAQAIGLSYGFNHYANAQFINEPTTAKYLFVAGMLTIGSIILTILGEYVNDKGLGSGISTLIFAGILSRVPQELYHAYQSSTLHIVLAVFAIMTLIIIFFEQSQLRLPMYYSKKFSGELTPSWIPIKINSAGVIPVIFAGSVFTIPSLIAQIFNYSSENEPVVQFIFECFNLAAKKGMITYAILVVMFTFFYAYVQINPEKMAENLQKSNGYLVGVRPGEDTENFVTKKLNRLNIIGAFYLMAITVFPIAQIAGVQHFSLLSGTSLLIIIGVSLEMYRQLSGKFSMTTYKGLLRKG